MKVLLVAGARPNFMKIAPVLAALRAAGDESILVHTGQHYDARMSDAFFDDLGLPDPDFHLGVGSGTHAVQTARVMEAFEPVLREVKPDWVVVVGDVNSTLACSLVAAKLKEETGCRIAHVEAGLRSRDWRMPEEINRILTDRLSDVLLIPSTDAISNLVAEGIDPARIAFVGNVMIDTLLAQLPAARLAGTAHRLGVQAGAYTVVTLHRPSNVDSAETLRPILEALADLAKNQPVVFPVHPRTRKNASTFGLAELLDTLVAIEPLSYVEMLGLTEGAALVLTDSGGLQEETTVLGVPCITLREQTERPITITAGTNRLAAWPLTREGMVTAAHRALTNGKHAPQPLPGWDGKAGTRVARALHLWLGPTAERPGAPDQLIGV